MRHVLLPALAPATIVGLYFAPVSLVGCANRGLMALAVALGSPAAAFVTVGVSIRCRSRNDPSASWWVISTLILALPLVLLLGPLG